MTKRVEDYALIGNMRTAALVSREASIEWLCLPRFDSDACFAALLGTGDNGHWEISPRKKASSVTRRYRGETLVLETVFKVAGGGEAAVIDFMALGEKDDETVHVVRIVEGRSGKVALKMELILRFDYGRITPWLQSHDKGFHAFSGPDAVRLVTPVALTNENKATRAEFTVAAGERVPFVLSHYASFKDEPPECGAASALTEAEHWWSRWSKRCEIEGEWREPVMRSLITLKALTDRQTGGMVGAPTCGLPELPGGSKNWDYRYTWLRDATFTLHALLRSGFDEEAKQWRKWLMRAAAADPSKLQPMYGISGERRIEQVTLDWLRGFEASQPVIIGNGAFKQNQLDVYGEIMNGLYSARKHGIQPDDDTWGIQRELVHYLERHWRDKGVNLWEGGAVHHFTVSKVMAWVAFDRAVKAVENFGFDGDVERWKTLRQEVHDEVCAEGFSKSRNSFVQYYGSLDLDAALLLLPIVGFLPADDPRIEGTVEAIRDNLVYKGFVYRYETPDAQGGAPASEGAFIICGFWLVDVLIMQGKHDEAMEFLQRLLSIRNDVGLLSEEYDPDKERLVGNFPQAFSHVGLINSIHNLRSGECGRQR